MKNWRLQWELLIVLLFQIGLFRLKKVNKTVWIGKNKRINAQNNIPWSVRLSARREIKKDMPWRIRLQWWRQEQRIKHPYLARYGLRLAISAVFLMFGLPVLFGGEVIIDNNATYAGSCDYDSHVGGNSNGNYVVVWGKNPNDRVCMKYSTDGGATWLPSGDNRVILFSSAGSGDGIIDSDYEGMWEYSCEVYKDVFYMVLHLGSGGTAKTTFTKCNIADVSNIATYSNWKSADGTPPPSQGNGSDGAGYDILCPTTQWIDPSIAVQVDNNILVTNSAGSDIQAWHWDGVSWSTGEIKDMATAISVTFTRHTEEGDWTITWSSGGNAHAMRCSSGDDPTVAANWKKFDGSAGHDIIMQDTITPIGFSWPKSWVDSNNYVHAVGQTGDYVDGFNRLWHNYWKPGTGWVEGTGEGSGARVTNGGDPTHPRTHQDKSPRNHQYNADSGGQLIMAYNDWNRGISSIKWDETDSWHDRVEDEVNVGKANRRIASEGYMRGCETSAPFLLGDANIKMTFLLVSGAISGDPWWDEIGGGGAGPGGGGAGQRLILPLLFRGV